MSSKRKFLGSGLNDWSTDDCPEMEDFKRDNALVTASLFNAYIHAKTGTVHTLTGAGVNIRFKAQAALSKGDTFNVNGTGVVARTLGGKPPSGGEFAAGSWVMAILDSGVLTLQQPSVEVTTEWVNAQLSNKANTSVRFQGDVTDFINVPSGFYQAGPDVTGMPGIGWWNVLVVSSGAASRSITAYDSITPITNHTFILNVVSEQMGKWVQLATAEPPQRFAISFASGWLNTTDSYFYKNQFGEVTIRAESTKDSAVDPLGTLFVLPEGYRPPRIIQFAITFSSPFATVIVMVEPNGRVSTRSGVTEAVRGYFMNITFAI